MFLSDSISRSLCLEKTPDSYYQELKVFYEERRNILCSGFDDVGLSYTPAQGAIYIWLKTPKDMDSFEFTKELFINTGILVVPGNGYSMEGGDYNRWFSTGSSTTHRSRPAFEGVA